MNTPHTPALKPGQPLTAEAVDLLQDAEIALRTLCVKYGYHEDNTPKDWSEWVEARRVARAIRAAYVIPHAPPQSEGRKVGTIEHLSHGRSELGAVITEALRKHSDGPVGRLAALLSVSHLKGDQPIAGLGAVSWDDLRAVLALIQSIPSAPLSEGAGEREVKAIARLIWQKFAPASDIDETNAYRGEYILAAHDIFALRSGTPSTRADGGQ